MRRVPLVLIAAFAYMLVPVLCPAPIFMKYEGVRGDVTEQESPEHDGWIRVDFFEMNSGRSSSSPGSITYEPIVVRTHVNKATPKLMLACANGTHYPETELHFIDQIPGTPPRTYMTIKLTDVQLTSYRHVGSGVPHSAEPLSTLRREHAAGENVSFNFGEIKMEYGGIRKTYYFYGPNGNLEETISEATITRIGGRLPDPDDSVPGDVVADSIIISDSFTDTEMATFDLADARIQ